MNDITEYNFYKNLIEKDYDINIKEIFEVNALID